MAHMLPVLIAIAMTPMTMTLTPTDDIWVYPHASDGAKDPFIRVWGNGGKSVAESAGDATEYSYGYFKWNVSSIPPGQSLVAAKLKLYNVPDPGFSILQAQAAPLEARILGVGFSEKDWSYDVAEKVSPSQGDASVFGIGTMAPPETGNDVSITIDLLVGKASFKEALIKALQSESKELAVALTSKLDPSELGMKAVYKVYSKDTERLMSRPTLVLTFENSGR